MPPSHLPTTSRLALRRFEPSDLPHLHRLESDPEVAHWLNPGGRTKSRAEVEQTLDSFLAYYSARPGLGYFVVEESAGKKFAGWVGLVHLGDAEDFELGYCLLPEFRGYGYATEAALALLGYGFGELELEKIQAVTQAENLNSLKVMERLSLKYPAQQRQPKADQIQYAFRRPPHDDNPRN